MTRIDDQLPVGVGIDGTAHSAAALEHATAEARRRGTGLRVVHVEPGFRPVMPHVLMIQADVEAIGKSILRDAAAAVQEADPELTVVPSLRRGWRVAELVAAAERCQLMVVGSESMHGIDRVLLGTTTAGVAAHAPGPVRVVPEGWTERDGPVAVGVRSTAQAESLVAHAAHLAAGRGGHVVVVHSWYLPDPYADRVETRVHDEDWRRAGHELLSAAIEPVRRRHPDVTFEIRVVHADPVTALLEVPDASLVLVERAHRTTWLPGTLGRTVRHLLVRSLAPVEVLPVGVEAVEESQASLEDAGTIRR